MINNEKQAKLHREQLAKQESERIRTVIVNLLIIFGVSVVIILALVELWT